MSDDDLNEIAIHEAAHAVVGCYLGQLAESVSIVPVGSTGGRTKIRKPKSFNADIPANYFALEYEIVISMAGAEAVKFYRENSGHGHLKADLGDGLDREEIRLYADTICTLYTDEQVDCCENRLRQFTTCVVADDKVWQAITAVAEQLLTANELSAAQVAATVKPFFVT